MTAPLLRLRLATSLTVGGSTGKETTKRFGRDRDRMATPANVASMATVSTF